MGRNQKIIAAALFCAVGLGLPTRGFGSDGIKVTFQNNSKWAIHELFLSTTKVNEWGPDQLGDKVIKTGEQFELTGIPVGKYDLKIVDEDGDECVVDGVKVALNEKVAITDENLVGCQVATEDQADD